MTTRRTGAVEKFHRLINRSGGPDACWPWMGARFARGYGQFGGPAWPNGTHRIAYELEYGPIPAGAVVRHRCDNPPCCNPKHLELGTHADNVSDRVTRGRSARGEGQPQARLTAAAVLVIRTRYAAGGVSQQALADQYGVNQTTISRVVRGVKWREAA